MKKLIYIILFSFVAGTIASCTDEPVEPNVATYAGGGSGSERPE